MTPPPSPQRTSLRLLDIVGLIAILCLTAGMAELWQAHKLLNQDEMFVLQTDGVRSLAEVARIQLHYPISLDPMVFHTLAHVATRAFGVTPFALRLPSLAGYLLMQVCLFFFVRRAVLARGAAGIAATAAGWLAALFPALTATLYYAAEARPYGLLLGLYSLALLAWQAATREQSARRWALPLLAVAIALALNAHYFAILLLPVLYLAEAVRTLERRRLDVPLVAALVAGTACFAFALPFQHAMTNFRTHYYNAGTISPRAVTQAYRSLFVDYTAMSLRAQHVIAMLFVLLAVIFLAALVLRWRTFALPRGEAVLIIALAALPFFGFVLARFVTHSYEVRYVIGAMAAISILLALLCAPLLARPAGASAALIVAALLVVFAGCSHVASERAKSDALLRSLEVSANVRAAMEADPTHNLYIQQMGHYELAQYYQPDPVVRAHTVLVYDSEREIRLTGHDTEALTAEHMLHFTSLPIVPFDSLHNDAAAHTWVYYTDGWDFAHKAFAEDDARVRELGTFFEGHAATVEKP